MGFNSGYKGLKCGGGSHYVTWLVVSWTPLL